jgi:hypothetical protein
MNDADVEIGPATILGWLRAIAANCLRRALTLTPWRSSLTPLTNWAFVGWVARID